MLIIDKRKDCYDYLQGINGIDKDVVLDRRKFKYLTAKDYFSYKGYRNGTFPTTVNFKIGAYIYKIQYIVSYDERGFVQNIICDKLIQKIPTTQHSDCIVGIQGDYWKTSYFNCLLLNMKLNSVISPEEIWDNIYSYLLSSKTLSIEDNRTDIQKLESKGFDKKLSFRNPIK